MRSVLDAILSVLRSGCAWRHLPREFPPWLTVHRWFLRLSGSGVFEHLAHALTRDDRERAGRKASPTGAVMDAQAAWASTASAATIPPGVWSGANATL